MIKIIRPNITPFQNALLAALIFTISYNLPVLVQRVSGTLSTSIPAEFSYLLLVFSATLTAFFILLKLPYIGKIIISILFLLSAAATYFTVSLNIHLDQRLMVSIFATHGNEASELLKPKLLAIITIWFLIPVTIVLTQKTEKREIPILKILTVITLLPIIAFILNRSVYSADSIKSALLTHPPYNYSNAVIKYFTKTKKSLLIATNKVNLYEKYGAKIDDNQNLKVVVIIGESARRKNFSINGYNRKTNPQLEKIKNITSFTTTTSCERYTQYSVPCLMSRVSKKDFSFPLKETSFVSIFKGVGFSTYWYDIQSAFSSNGMPVFQIALEADRSMFRNEFVIANSSNPKVLDERLLPYFKDALKNNNRELIILHTDGSHYDYSQRYPENFEIFKPTCTKQISDCTKQEIVNTYDNSVLYTDNFISEVISALKDHNALLLYISDHGESLGENGLFLHGTPEHEGASEQFDVPMIWWASNKFLANKKNAKKYQALVANKKSALPTSHENIFHSILDCSGIKSDAVTTKLSLCH